MNRSLFGQIAIILSLLIVFIPVSVKSMDQQGDLQASSSLVSKLAVVTLVPTAGFMYVMRRHYNELHVLERSLDLSTIAANAREGNFRFATWRSTQDNCIDGKCWATASDVWQDGRNIAAVLMRDVKYFADRVFVYDALNLRLDNAKIEKHDLQAAIAREKQLFETQLNLVSHYTNAPYRIVAALAPNDTRCLTPSELAINCALKLKESDDVINQVENDLKQEASFVKELIYFGGWLPTSWSIAPCSQKASRLYIKLFRAYARLCALEAALNQE
ncbi:MAG: hypothetical protein AB7F19_07115 [Candidatus Babeliales bacterium]